MSKIDFLQPHSVAGIIMIGLVAIHLILHFNWIKVMSKKIFFKKERQQTI